MYSIDINELQKNIYKIVKGVEKLEHNQNDNKYYLPFYTRNPERFSFKTSTNGIIGSYFRSFTKNEIPGNLDREIKRFCASNEVVQGDSKSQQKLEEFLLNYVMDDQQKVKLVDLSFYTKLPLSTPLKQSTNRIGDIEYSVEKQGIGEVTIGKFLSNVYPLDEELLTKINEGNTNPILKRIFSDLRSEGSVRGPQEKKKIIGYFSNLQSLFLEDIKHLATNNKFFIESFELVLMHYYFTYITQFTLQCGRLDTSMQFLFPQFYTYELAPVSKTMDGYNYGWNRIKNEKNHLYYNVCLLTHLNFSNDEKAYTLKEIGEKLTIESLDELLDWIETYSRVGKLEDKDNLLEGIKIRKNAEEVIVYYQRCIGQYYKINKSANASADRYDLSIDEVARRYFLKKRGPLGNVLNITQDFLIVMCAICIKEEKIHVNKLFEEFQKRGIYLDRTNKEYILKVLGDLNLIIKQSDSGDVQYVKSIL